MNQIESELFALQHQKYLLQAYGPLCKAAGFENVDAMQGGDAYFLASSIMGAVKSRAPYVIKGAFGTRDYLGALKKMSQRELQEVRKRIR